MNRTAFCVPVMERIHAIILQIQLAFLLTQSYILLIHKHQFDAIRFDSLCFPTWSERVISAHSSSHRKTGKMRFIPGNSFRELPTSARRVISRLKPGDNTSGLYPTSPLRLGPLSSQCTHTENSLLKLYQQPLSVFYARLSIYMYL